MKRWGMLLAALALGCGAITLVGRYAAPAPTYTVAQIKDGLRQQPGQWAGRTVLVRGAVMGATTMNVCTSTDIRSSNLCTQQQSWTIGSTGAGRWVSVSTTMLGGSPIASNGGGFVTVKAATVPLYLSRASLPAQELAVAALHGARPPASRARQMLPDAAYTLPVVGPLAARFFPRNSSGVYRVRLLDPRICAQVTRQPCADAVLAP